VGDGTVTALEVTAVRSDRDMKAFVELPWSVYEKDSCWVPPIKRSVARLLNPKKHPFWAFSERELLLARRGSETVGRIAAIVDGNHNRYHGERMCAWGFFECRQDPEVAAGLFSAVEGWARKQGMAFLRGPLNPSTNYEIGLLVEGFDTPPALMMPYNPAYYPELVFLCGHRKEKDLYAYRITEDHEIPPWILDQAERAGRRSGLRIRRMKPDPKGREEMRLIQQVYRDCWSRNWGFVPMTDKEVTFTIRELMPIFDPDFAFFLYHGDEAVGLCVIVPDVNPLLKRFNGSLGPAALVKKFLYASEISGLRGLLFGIKEAYRQSGAPYFVLGYLLESLRKRSRYRYLELGWNLEDNAAINLLYEEGGARPAKRYRLYRKDL
jgi:hypothetical protein